MNLFRYLVDVLSGCYPRTMGSSGEEGGGGGREE